MTVLLSACGQMAPLTATELHASTAPAARITLSPTTGMTNTPVTIEGAGFAPQEQMQIGFTSSVQSHEQFVIGDVNTGSIGDFRLIFVIPLSWKDGSLIDDDTLSFWAQSNEKIVLATATYRVTKSSADSRTTLSNTSATPPATQIFPTANPAPTKDVTKLTGTSVETTATPVTIITGTPSVTAIISVTNPVATASLSREPINVSIAFLNSLLRDPTGASSLAYLSQRLRNEITANWVLPTGLGIQPGYNSFEVALLSHIDSTYVIQAIMSYESGASVRNFTVINENNTWLIDKIVIGIR
ncbi:MAG TPA: hypothetical protein VGK87_11525 [Anaerolineae bacterium]